MPLLVPRTCSAEEFVIGMVIVTRLNTGEYASADDIPVFAGAPAAPAAAATPPACAEAEVAVPDANMSTKLSALFVKFDGSTGPGTLSSAKVTRGFVLVLVPFAILLRTP